MTFAQLKQRAIKKELSESLEISAAEIDILMQQVVDIDFIRFTIPDGKSEALELVEAGKIHTLGNGGRYISGLGLRQIQKLVDPGARVFMEVN